MYVYLSVVLVCRYNISLLHILMCLYLGTHASIDGVSVPWPALGKCNSAAAKLSHEFCHVHDGNRVKAARQPRQVLDVVTPESRTMFVNTPRGGLACRDRLVSRRVEVVAGARRVSPASPDRLHPGSEAGPHYSDGSTDSGIPDNDSCKHMPYSSQYLLHTILFGVIPAFQYRQYWFP